VKFVYLNLTLVFVFSCTPIRQGLIEKESQWKFEGFTSDSKFQVQCSISIFQSDDKAKRREALLEICKKNMVTRLAEFKIAYDYNVKNLRFRGMIYDNPAKPGYSAVLLNQSEKIVHLDRLSTEWEGDAINLLLKQYAGYFPGRVIYEWVEKDKEYFLYSIQKPSLMNELKNTPLPFGVEFQSGR